MTKLLSPSEAANLLQLRRGTLASWRSKGIGPAYIKAGRKVLYEASDIERWLRGRRRQGEPAESATA